ncbi:MAG: hypothetical protein ABID84_05635 [Chloroflexota bacterium]
MTTTSRALGTLPDDLRSLLLAEYQSIVQNYLEHRWSPSELSGGKFCEVVYTILEGHAQQNYPARPSKPHDFVSACRKLEANSHVPRSFQILIPRLLPALYEVRNNRGVGHVGGDVDPNHMDAVLVLSMANWIMAELIRVLHDVSIEEAQGLVNGLAERRMPLVWHGEGVKRVLDPKLSLKDQLLLLIASAPSVVSTSELLKWSGYGNKAYFLRLLLRFHAERLVEVSTDASKVQILPPGSRYVEELAAKLMEKRV